MTASQPEESTKTFYAIYDRKGSDHQIVRVLEAENIDDAWDIAETLEPNLYAVEDIPPTGDVLFLDDSMTPYTWRTDRADLGE